MRFIFPIFGLLALGFSTVAQAECVTCDKEVSLTPSEWQCLGTKLPRYARFASDPTFIPLTQCNSVPQAETQRAVDYRIPAATAVPDSTATTDAAPSILRISRADLACLAAQIEQLASDPTEGSVTFKFAESCEADRDQE